MTKKDMGKRVYALKFNRLKVDLLNTDYDNY